MPVRTNRQPGDLVEAEDVNDVARVANSTEARVTGVEEEVHGRLSEASLTGTFATKGDLSEVATGDPIAVTDVSMAAALGDPASETSKRVGRIALIAEDFASVQAALDACPPGGRVRITANHTLTGDVYTVDRPMTIEVAPGVTLEQTAYAKPVFDVVNADHVTILADKALLYGSAPRPDWDATGFRSDSRSMYWCGVWSNGNYGYFDVKVDGFTCGVYLTNVDTTLTDRIPGPTGLKVGNKVRIDSIRSDFALNYFGQDTLEIASVRARDTAKHTGSYAAPHAVYGSGNASYISRNVRVGALWADNNDDSFAYQFKWVDGLTLGDFHATRHSCLLHLMDCNNVTAGNGVMTSPIGRLYTGVDIVLTTAGRSDNIVLGSLSIEQQDQTNATAVAALGMRGSRIRVRSLYARSNVTDTHTPVPIIAMNGTDLEVGSVVADMVGQSRPVYNIGAGAATNRVLAGPVSCNKYRTIADVHATATNVLIKIEPATLAGGLGLGTVRPINGSTVGYRVTVAPSERTLTVGGAAVASNAVDVFLATRTWYKITDAAAITVATPIGVGYVGATHEVVIENGTTGPLGTITWDAAWAVMSFPAPPPGSFTRATFRYNGTTWAQI